LGGVKSGQGLQCLVNPKVGKEIDIFEKAKQIKILLLSVVVWQEWKLL